MAQWVPNPSPRFITSKKDLNTHAWVDINHQDCIFMHLGPLKCSNLVTKLTEQTHPHKDNPKRPKCARNHPKLDLPQRYVMIKAFYLQYVAKDE